MQIEFQAKPKTRVLNRHIVGVIIERDIKDVPLWWSYSEKKWSESPNGMASNMAPIHSFRAFKKHLRKQKELAGETVILVSRHDGHDVIARM